MIVAEPTTTPYNVPDASTLAVDDALLLHVPPLVASAKAVVAPVHTVVVPVIDAGVDGVVITVTPVVTNALPQALVTV